MMTKSITSAGPDAPAFWAPLPDSVVALMRWLARRREARAIRATARDLDRLDDHMLRDMGFVRGGIEARLRDLAELERKSRFGW